jgi:hypothetical protein
MVSHRAAFWDERERAPSSLLTIRDRVARRAFRRKAEQFGHCDGSAVFARCGGYAVLAAPRPRDDLEVTSSAIWCRAKIRCASVAYGEMDCNRYIALREQCCAGASI